MRRTSGHCACDPRATTSAGATLRWCQKYELGRVLRRGACRAPRVRARGRAWTIPRRPGFRLSPSSTVMHQVTPSRPHAAWDRHSFGTCDVASLQEQFGTPTMSTLISGCNDVDTLTTLAASATQVGAGGRLVAHCHAADPLRQRTTASSAACASTDDRCSCGAARPVAPRRLDHVLDALGGGTRAVHHHALPASHVRIQGSRSAHRTTRVSMATRPTP